MNLNLTITLSFFLALNLQAQTFKKVLGQPIAFESPTTASEFHLLKTEKSTTIAWKVYGEEEDMPTYSNPKPDAARAKELSFLEQYYVVEETKEWVHLVKASVSGLDIESGVEDYFWVEKRKVLMWDNALIDENTQIFQKIILFPDANDLQLALRKDKVRKVNFYRGAFSGQLIENTLTDDQAFYYVLKRENRRVLVATSPSRDSSNIQDYIPGWVTESQIKEWNTRLALEPNFEEAAFEKRKKDQNLRMVAHHQSAYAERHSKSGTPEERGIIWDKDPILLPEMADEKTPTRLKINANRLYVVQSQPVSFQCWSIMNGKTLTTPELKYLETFFDEEDYLLYNKKELLEQHQIVVNAFVPYQIAGTTYPPFSPVVLFSRSELEDYLNNIKTYSTSLTEKKPKIQRKLFADLYLNLARSFGEKWDRGTVMNMSPNHIRYLLQGIREPVPEVGLNYEEDIPLENLLSVKKVSDKDLAARIQQFLERQEQLTEILQEGEAHAFSFESGGMLYFWIPLKLIL